jgi:hypothetical protein
MSEAVGHVPSLMKLKETMVGLVLLLAGVLPQFELLAGKVG